MISIEQLMRRLARDAQSPGEMVQLSLAGQLPYDAAPAMPMALGGPPRPSAQPAPDATPTPSAGRMADMAAPEPVRVAQGPSIPGNALLDLSMGLHGGRPGGISGALGMLMAGPEQRAAQAQQMQRQQAEERAVQNMTIKALMQRNPNMTPEMAGVIARNSGLLKDFLANPSGSDFDIVQAKDGAILRVPKTSGEAQPVYKADPTAMKPQMSAADKKAVYAAEDDLPALESTIDTLNKALQLNEKTYTGYTAGLRGSLGAKAPDWLVPDFIAEPGAATDTNEFSNIMSMEAIKAMSETLKGATTDREMNKFIEMLGDPTTPPKTRENIIKRMLALAQRKKDIATSRIEELRGGTYFNPRDGSAGPLSQAPARAQDKDGNVIEWNGTEWLPVQ